MALANLSVDDTTIDEAFMYYLKTRAFDIDSMIQDYITYAELNSFKVRNRNLVLLDNYLIAHQRLISDPLNTRRLTNTEAKKFFTYMKNKQSNAYNTLTALTLKNSDYGKNLKRNSITHWRLFLEDYNLSTLANGAINLNGLELFNFTDTYIDNAVDIAADKLEYNTFVEELVEEQDKQKKEIVDFKFFLKSYLLPVDDINTTTIQNAFYTDLIENSSFTHDIDNVIARLIATKRWKRRVLAKILP